ncbi:MAG: hypothetical protein ACE5H7_05500 [Acidiferrobacterales bacterium]
MKYLDINTVDLGAETGADTAESAMVHESRLAEFNARLRELPSGHDPLARVRLQLDMGRALLALQRGAEAWNIAREAFDSCLTQRHPECAVEACDILFLADQSGSLSALGQGVWLAVTYPIDPELTVAMLQHVVDETPLDADGAAVAATVAAYVVDLRAEGKQRDELTFFANQMLATVARHHSNVENQADFNTWMEQLELNDPSQFLPRLRNVVDVLVQDDWWIDRDALQARLPVN